MEWNRNYPFVVWISTLLLGPIVYFTIFSVNKTADFSAIFQIIFFFFLFGFLFSAPAFFIYLFLLKFLLKDNLPLLGTKILSCLTAIVTLICTMYVIGGGDFDKGSYEFILAYSIPIVLSSLLLKLKKSQQSF